MTLEALAAIVVDTAARVGVEFMTVGTSGDGAFGVPRSTKDVDLLVSLDVAGGVGALAEALAPSVEFDRQVQFDTLTWGGRIVGKSRSVPPFKVELFEMFDDPFVHSEFSRRRSVFVPMLNRNTWLPTPEDVIVQKLRWGRSKDLDAARDVLAVQGTESLDMAYIENWCAKHHTTVRLRAALAGIPPL